MVRLRTAGSSPLSPGWSILGSRAASGRKRAGLELGLHVAREAGHADRGLHRRAREDVHGRRRPRAFAPELPPTQSNTTVSAAGSCDVEPIIDPWGRDRLKVGCRSQECVDLMFNCR